MNLRRIIWQSRWLTDKQKIEWYPTFWLMRIKVLELSNSWRTVRILLPHSWLATNTGGSLFGGFQACLADPIAAMSCVRHFPNFSVWTRSLTLDFIHPGLTDLELRFNFDENQQKAIEVELAEKGRSNPKFEYGYYLKDGRLCTKVYAAIAIRPLGYQKNAPANNDRG